MLVKNGRGHNLVNGRPYHEHQEVSTCLLPCAKRFTFVILVVGKYKVQIFPVGRTQRCQLQFPPHLQHCTQQDSRAQPTSHIFICCTNLPYGIL